MLGLGLGLGLLFGFGLGIGFAGLVALQVPAGSFLLRTASSAACSRACFSSSIAFCAASAA